MHQETRLSDQGEGDYHDDWPEHVEEYDVTGNEIVAWDLVYAASPFLASDTNFRSDDPLEPYKESMKALQNLGVV